MDPSKAGSHARLGAELEAAVVRALLRDWEYVNYAYFRRRLVPPVFSLCDAEGRLGQWSLADRTIEMSRRLVLDHAWGIVVEVLKHEMAHQYAHEALNAHGETAHGEAFRRVCSLLGIDPAASGRPRGSGALPDEATRILTRIAKLLALAESTNVHEAELAMSEAQRLMLKHNVESAHAGRKSEYGFRHLGEPTGRTQAHQRTLAMILGTHFFVEPIWVTVHRPLVGKPGTVLEVCGTEPNLEMAAYVHDFLLHVAESLWLDHKRVQRVRSDAHRRSFLVGVMRGFGEKLDKQKEQHRTEGLVWVGDAHLGDYFDTRYPRQQKTYSTARTHPGAFAEGQKAGRQIVLNKPVTTGASGTARALLSRGD